MTEEKYKELLEKELELLNKFSKDDDFLYLLPDSASNLLQLIELKLKIADRLFQLEERENHLSLMCQRPLE